MGAEAGAVAAMWIAILSIANIVMLMHSEQSNTALRYHLTIDFTVSL